MSFPLPISKCCLIVLLATINFNAFSQEVEWKGAVYDEDKSAIAGATIHIPSIHAGTVTDATGKFTINIAPGTYYYEVKFPGYATISDSIDLGSDLSSTFTLKESVSDLDPFVITGTMRKTYLSKSPVKVEVITSKQIETFLPSAGTSIVDNIQLVNGVQEVTACGVCYTNSISINGLPGPYTAILMDGTPIYGSLASVYGLNGIPNMIIDRFEVIKGPNSTLYGSEAVAGVINIITKNPENEPLISADIMGTSHVESFGNISLAPKWGKSSGFIGLNYAYLNRYEDVNGDGFGDGINMDRISLFTKWNIHRKSKKKWTMSGKYYYEDRRNGVKEFLNNRNYRELRGDDSIYGESIYTNRAELFGTYHFNLKGNLRLDYSLSHHDQNSFYGADAYIAQQSIVFGNFIWDIDLKKQFITVGATTRFNRYDDNSVATETLTDGIVQNQPNAQFIPGLFVQDEYTPNEKWTLLGGVRLDHYTSHGFITSPRLSAKYTPIAGTTIRSNFGTGFRIVNLFTEDHAFVTGQREVKIIEDLKPEESYNGSLSINQLYAGRWGNGSIGLESFYTYFTNKILPDYNDPALIVYANSSGHAITRGLGISINHYFKKPAGFSLSFNRQNVTESEIDQNGTVKTRQVEFAPKWSWVATFNVSIPRYDLTIAYTARGTGPMALPEVFDLDENGEPINQPRPTTSEPFALHNLQVSKPLKNNWSVYAGIQNITNFRQQSSPLVGYNDPNAPTGFSPYFDTSYAFAPNHGREVYVGVKWMFEDKQ